MHQFDNQNYIVDQDEIDTYNKYLELPNKLPKLCTLDYHTYQTQNPSKIVKQSRWTQFTETIFSEDDYENVRTVNDAFREFKQDLETFDNFSNFDYKRLESYKLEQIVLSQEPEPSKGPKPAREEPIEFNPCKLPTESYQFME